MTNYWKTIAGQCIYQSQSPIMVYQNPWYRWLTFKDKTTLQTLINRRNPHNPALDYLGAFTCALRINPGPTCLLGLGGAGVAHLAAPYLLNNPLIAVEHNAEVISIAATYFMTNILKNLTILHQDAADYIVACHTQYQHILIDIYTDAGFPPQCSHADFFTTCKRLLLPNGVLALNLANIHQEHAVLTQLRAVFNQSTLCIPVRDSTNMIILAADSPQYLLHIIQKDPQLKTLIWDQKFGYMAGL